MDCVNTNKTKTYIEHLKSSPLEVCLRWINATPYPEEAFILVVPHIGQLRSLSVSGDPTQILPVLIEHFSRPTPLLNELSINLLCGQTPRLPNELFNRDLSSLCKLSLVGVTMPLPWRNLLNLTMLNLCRIPKDTILLTQLLDFLESTPVRIRSFSPSTFQLLHVEVPFPHPLILSYFSFPFSFTITQYFQGQLDRFFDWLWRTL